MARPGVLGVHLLRYHAIPKAWRLVFHDFCFWHAFAWMAWNVASPIDTMQSAGYLVIEDSLFWFVHALAWSTVVSTPDFCMA